MGDGRLPIWVRLGNLIDRWGAPAILGRPLNWREVTWIETQKAIIEAEKARNNSNKWAEDAERNPEPNRLLNWAMRVYEDGK